MKKTPLLFPSFAVAAAAALSVPAAAGTVLDDGIEYSGTVLTWEYNSDADSAGDVKYGAWVVTTYDADADDFDYGDAFTTWDDVRTYLAGGIDYSGDFNTVRFDAEVSGETPSDFSFTNLYLAGIIVEDGATGYSISAAETTSARNIYLGQYSTSTVAYTSIGEDFTLSNAASSSEDSEFVFPGTQVWTIAPEATFTLETATAFYVKGTISIDGGGTAAFSGATFNLASDANGAFAVSDASTLTVAAETVVLGALSAERTAKVSLSVTADAASHVSFAGTTAVTVGSVEAAYSLSATFSATDASAIAITSDDALAVATLDNDATGTVSVSFSADGAGSEIALSSAETTLLGDAENGSGTLALDFSATNGGKISVDSDDVFYLGYENSTVSAGTLDISFSADGDGSEVALSGAGTTYVAYASGTADSFTVAFSATDGGSVALASDGALYVGYKSNTGEAPATVTISAEGAGSAVSLAGNGYVYVGYLNANGAATLGVNVSADDGAAVTISASDGNGFYLGYNGSKVSSEGAETISVSAENGGNVAFVGDNEAIYIGYAAGAGTQTIALAADGDGSAVAFSSTKAIYVGDAAGSGALAIEGEATDGAELAFASGSGLYVGYNASSAKGTNAVAFSADGDGSALTFDAGTNLYVGYGRGSGTTDVTLAATDGAAIALTAAETLHLGYLASGSGTLSVTISAAGTGSSLALEADSIYANEKAGTSTSVTISVTDGATFTTSVATEAVFTATTIAVSGAGTDGTNASWTVAAGETYISDETTLTVSDGGTLAVESGATLNIFTSEDADEDAAATVVFGNGATLALSGSGNIVVSAGADIALGNVIVQLFVTAETLAELGENGFIYIGSSDVTFAVAGTISLEIYLDGVTAADIEGLVLVNASTLGIGDTYASTALIRTLTIDGEEISDIASVIACSSDGIYYIATVPEPAAFGAFAGTVALVLTALLRRRGRTDGNGAARERVSVFRRGAAWSSRFFLCR